MKKIFNILAVASVFSLASCDLDLYPVTGYNEGNVTVDEEDGNESQYKTRADMEGLRNSIYNSWVKNIQEAGYSDWLIYSEVRADNAYAGSNTTGEIMAIEANTQDGENKNVDRDWGYFQSQISNANQIICNIDRIAESDPSLTGRECQEWKAEALCWRAYNLYCMSQLWGDISYVTEIPPAITSENVEEVYHIYYPAKKPKDEVYGQMIEDLEYACEFAPDVVAGNKGIFTKGFANGLMARVYAESQRRDWEKVKTHCAAVESMGYELCDSYGDLWAYDDNDAARNTKESIFEVQWTKSSGNWVWMMFHRNAYNPNDSFDWMKWVTPSRLLVKAYDDEGDEVRKNVSIVWDACKWSNYYPADNYAFMHKMPTNASSLILMRLAEIYLLHAEALAMTGSLTGEGSAEYYVNKVRSRAGLAPLPAGATASREAMIDAILKERRLELAFEGFRFFDLVRHGKAKEVHDNAPSLDSYYSRRTPLTEQNIIMPIPVKAMDTNPSLEQNPGY